MIQAFAGYTVVHSVREDDQFVLLRATRDADGAPVLVRYARPGRGMALARIEHEYTLRSELDPAWAATPISLVHGGATVALVLSDCNALPLQLIPGQALDPAAFVRVAAAIAHALVQLHRRDIVHMDLRAEHILLDPSGAARLTGFGLATRLRGLPQLPEAYNDAGFPCAGFPYLAPARNGRVAHPIDTRTDLYCLGVLLYQLLCGAPPFEAADCLQTLEPDEPPAPDKYCSGVDPTLAGIVLKLLTKNVEQRYQSAAGLCADLGRCQAMLTASGVIEPFMLAGSDSAARLQMPATLVGRAEQLAVLEQAARQVALGAAQALVTVSGLAGTGKSALLAALLGADTVAGASVVTVKFEQHGRGVPYAALAGAWRELVRRRLGQGQVGLAAWRATLLAALGQNGRLMLELIPELVHVIGEQPKPVSLAPLEAQNRFHAVFRRFVSAFAEDDAMVLLCLDDLQWIDPASLKLLIHLVTHPEARRLLVVAACRAGDDQAGDPLAALHAAVRRQGSEARQVTLTALTRAESALLVAGALGCPPEVAAPLAELAFGKCGGNPLFTLQFLTGLAESGLLRYQHGAARWDWDAGAIGSRRFSDNLVDLMIARLRQLPDSTLELVELLACLGHNASLTTLAEVAGMSALETDESLWPAARIGLVLRDGRACRFAHDRVREAAYSLIAPASLPERHLHIGRSLLARLGPGQLEGEVFAVTGHLNRARAAIDDPAELQHLADLNAQAGTRARAAIAYDAARHHFDLAAALTPTTAWQQRTGPTFALYSALAEAEYLCGNLVRAASLCALLAEHARSRLELAQVALLQVALNQVAGRFDLAVAVALEALARFGVTFPETTEAVAAALACERAAVAGNLAGRSMADLEQESASVDPELAIVAELLTDMGSSVFSARPLIYPLLAVKALNFTLRFGATAAACATYSRYAILLVSLGAIDDAFAFSELALRLAERGGAAAHLTGRLRLVHAAYVHPWRLPVASSVALLDQACLACQEAGDAPHAGYAAHIATWASFEAGAALDEVQRRARNYQDLARQQNNEALMQLLRGYEQLTLCLQGATGSEGSLDDPRFSGRTALAAMERASFGAARARYHLMRQVGSFTFGRYHEALLAAEAAARGQQFMLASIGSATHHVYHALAMTALYRDAAPGQRAVFMAALQDKHARLRTWAGHCPDNFGHRFLLVSAELARLDGRDGEATQAYDAALAAARAGAFVQDEALVAERAALFYRQNGFEQIALTYARAALQACARWGAYGKMLQLERHFPGLVRVPAPLPGPPDCRQ